MEHILEDEQENLLMQGFSKDQANFLWSLKLLVRDGRLGGVGDADSPFKHISESVSEEGPVIADDVSEVLKDKPRALFSD